MNARAPDSETPSKPRGGRPRTRPAEHQGSGGVRAWREQLKRLGGGEVRAYLGGDALRALKAMAKIRVRGPLIERLILDEWNRRRQAQP